jgi:hypothetical protein
LKKLIDNIDNLPRIALEWAMDSKKTHLLPDLLHSYRIPYKHWEGTTDNCTKRVLQLAIDRDDRYLAKSLLERHNAIDYEKRLLPLFSRSQKLYENSVPNLALEWAVKADSPNVVKEATEMIQTRGFRVVPHSLARAATWAIKTERVDVLKQILGMSKASHSPNAGGSCKEAATWAIKTGNVDLLKEICQIHKFEDITSELDREFLSYLHEAQT